MTSRLSERGQVVIPKPLRKRLGLRPGQLLDFVEDGGRLVVTKVGSEDPVEKVYGVLRLRRSTDAFIEALRGKPDGR
jgi:AbrB family looped-hinge helix DNA binding protein